MAQLNQTIRKGKKKNIKRNDSQGENTRKTWEKGKRGRGRLIVLSKKRRKEEKKKRRKEEKDGTIRRGIHIPSLT